MTWIYHTGIIPTLEDQEFFKLDIQNWGLTLPEKCSTERSGSHIGHCECIAPTVCFTLYAIFRQLRNNLAELLVFA